MRIVRTPAAPGRPWRRSRRWHDLDLTLPVRRVEDLFATPGSDPFDPGYGLYGDRPGIEQVAAVVDAERPKGSVRLTVELPAEPADDGVEERVRAAIGRYCHARIAGQHREERRTRSTGTRLLVVALLAVIVLNALASTLDSTGDDVLSALSQGLQVAAWVTLWVPIGMLVYDRAWYRRDQRLHRMLLLVPVRVTGPGPS